MKMYGCYFVSYLEVSANRIFLLILTSLFTVCILGIMGTNGDCQAVPVCDGTTQVLNAENTTCGM